MGFEAVILQIFRSFWLRLKGHMVEQMGHMGLSCRSSAKQVREFVGRFPVKCLVGLKKVFRTFDW